ncbi:MAG TPA: glycosyltransferase [Usitatibacter sp.]|jgi:GT2 family glycosyltransferase|nr:glycosyltransferase [Usitatibacter sp.]
MSAPEDWSHLERRLADAERDLAFHKALLAERDAQIASLRHSISWRITGPLRAAGAVLKRCFAAIRAVRALSYQLGGYGPLFKAILTLARREGANGVWGRTLRAVKGAHAEYREWSPHASADDPWGDATGADLGNEPLISVLMPVYNTPMEMLDAAIWSVRRQTYAKWELIAVDDASTSPKVRSVLQFHAAQEPRVKIKFRTENGNISAALNTALEMASGEFMVVLDHDDVLDPKALYGIAREIDRHPEADYIYSDEDKLNADGTVLYGPFYKPDWSPEYLLSLMYTCHLGAYRMSVVREIGGYRTEFDGAQDFDFTLRFLLKTERVRHVPRVLYHWRVWEASTAHSPDAKPLAEERARKALEEYLTARGERFTIGPGPRAGHHEVRFLPRSEPLVSIAIPTANGKVEIDGRTEWHLDAVVESIFEKTTYRKIEVVVVHNGDLREDQLERLGRLGVKLVEYRAAKFSLAEKINLGAASSTSEYLVLMNDDIRVITPDWIERMLGMAQREGVGAVGPKLLFPDGRIQHAGVVILGGCPGHAYYEWPGDAEGYGLGAAVARNYLAVTGACMMTPRRLFEELGGFAARFPLNYNDVDYCLRLHERGLRSVYLPSVSLYHYEGVSKEGGRNVGKGELEAFQSQWAAKVGADPYYNCNLSQTAPYQF